MQCDKQKIIQNLNPHLIVSVMYTLTVLETCVKNCDMRFTTLVCQKDFVAELVKLISAKHDAPLIVQERVLALIQVSWWLEYI